MRTFFQDEFMNKKLFERVKKEIRQQQLEKTIGEINYLNEIQNQLLERNNDFSNLKKEIEFITKLNNARRKNLQA